MIGAPHIYSNNNGGGLTAAQVQAMIDASVSNNSGAIPVLTANPTDFSVPTAPRVWIVGNELRFWDGTAVNVMDTKSDNLLKDLSGNNIVID